MTHHIYGDYDRDFPQSVRDVLNPMADALDRQFRAARASSVWGDVIDGLLADPNMAMPGADQF